MQAKEVIEQIRAYSGVEHPMPKTCDGYKAGNENTEVTGIVTTFMATVDVIRQAHALGANLIITHEPTYFTGHETTAWCKGDSVYEAKCRLIIETGMTIWRYHDMMHMAKTDGIYDGFIEEMGWHDYVCPPAEKPGPGPGEMHSFVEAFRDYYDIPQTTLGQLARQFKEKLGISTLQLVGDIAMPCSRIGVLVGGGSLGFGTEEMPMQIMERKKIDVLVCGEITEWTTSAYVNDAAQLGLHKGMIVLGHERSEEWGMKHMAGWLAPLVDVPVHFVDAKEPFVYV